MLQLEILDWRPRPTRRSVRRTAILGLICSTTLVLACSSGGSDSSPANGGASAPAADSGAQTVTGNAPAAVGNDPAIVVLEPIGGGAPAPQASAPAMDQEQQTFVPALLLVRTGQPVNFLNHDDVLHNVRVRNDETKESAFNVAIPTGEKFEHTFARDGFYDVGCDIHPGMSALIVSTTSPFASLADAAGAFSFAGVPNGPYKAVAYSGAQTITKEIIVGAGMAPIDLTKP